MSMRTNRDIEDISSVILWRVIPALGFLELRLASFDFLWSFVSLVGGFELTQQKP